MVLKHKSSAWLLVGLQAAFSLFFLHSLSASFGGSLFGFGNAPTSYGFLFTVLIGLTLILGLTALSNFSLTAIVLLFAVHTVCPVIFFTDLTRNPYYTQITLLNVWVLLLWAVWLWEFHKEGRFYFPKTPLNLPLAVFTGIATLSWAASFVQHGPSFYESMFAEGLRTWIFLVVNGLLVFFLAVAVEDRWRTRFIWTTFFVGLLAAVYGLMQFYGIETVWQKSLTPFVNRPVSTFGNPNFLSSYLLMLVPLLVVWLCVSRNFLARAWSLAIVVVVLGGIVATMTRSTWVGTLAALAALPLAPPFRELARRNFKVIAVLAGALVLGLALWPDSKLGGYNPVKRLVEIREVKQEGGYQPWHQRILIWSSSLEMIRDHPVLGKGWGLFELFYPYYQGKLMFHSVLKNYRTHANNCHNELFEIWTQTGIVGMGVYVWIWVVILLFGYKLSRELQSQSFEKSVLAWALTSAAFGMLVDNFFGNVSIHFAVPAFLFWWQLGLLFGLNRSDSVQRSSPAEWYSFPLQNNFHRLLLCAAAAFLVWASAWNFRREFQEVYYFRGFKLSKMPGQLEPARQELEKAWKWFPREVNSNYEMANTYARLSQQSHQAGLSEPSIDFRNKSIWAYRESLRSNAGYDEIYFNLGAVQMQMGWAEDEYAEFSAATPRGLEEKFSGKNMPGAISNFSRALAINPLSLDGYTFLGNVYLQNQNKYRPQAILLFERAVQFYPRNKEFWVNLGYLQVQENQPEKAYESIRQALMLDASFDYARRNLTMILAKLNRKDDPLEAVVRDLPRINSLIDARNWKELEALSSRMLKTLPDNFQLRFVLGNSYVEQGQFEKAEQEYLKALRAEPDNGNALNNYALVSRQLQKFDQARAAYKKMAGNPAFADAAKRGLDSLPK